MIPPPSFLSPVRVLIAEDRAVDARLARSALAGEDFETRVATTAADIRQAIDRFDPQCILLDIDLPGGSGLELAREAKARARPPLVILVTAYSNRYTEDDAISVGADAFLRKPFDVRALPDIIRSLVEDVE